MLSSIRSEQRFGVAPQLSLSERFVVPVRAMQATKTYPVHGSTANGGRERRLKCMYTSQLTKKRKTWSDGILKVYFSGGSYQCSLLDGAKLRETVLISRQLESVEIQALKKNEEIELDFEGYLVTVSAGNPELDAAKIGPPLKLPKFVPPSRFVPPIRHTEQIPNTSSTSTSKSIVSSKGPYRVSNDELDDIWDCDQPPQKYSAASKTIESDNAPPAFMVYSGNAASSHHQGNARTSSRPVSGPSVQATLRLTGANAPNDASQPALTRFFAPSAPAPAPARPAPTPAPVAAAAHALPTQLSSSHYNVPNHVSTNQTQAQGYSSRPPYPSSTASRSTSEDQNFKKQAGQDNPTFSSRYPPSRSFHTSHNNNQHAVSNGYMYEHAEGTSAGGVNIEQGGYSSHYPPTQPSREPVHRSAPPQQPSQITNPVSHLPQESFVGNTQHSGRHNNNDAAVAGVASVVPAQAAYSTIISSSVWDSD